MAINIRSDISDPFYRYKMEPLQSKIEGKGNGIKTVVPNLSSVAQSLARPPAYVIKYFGFELGAQTNNNPADDRWIINGAHEASKLQEYLKGFIDRFVLCKKCKNPETDVIIKDGRIVLDCKACGQRSDVDLRLKLSSFILKTQPKKGKKDKKDKRSRRAKGKDSEDPENGALAETNGSGSDNDDDDGEVGIAAGSDDELTRRIKAEADQLEDNSEIKDDDWAVDVSEEAVKARAKQLPDDLKQKLVFDEEDDGEGDGSAESAYEQLGSWIVSSGEKLPKGVDDVNDIDIYIKAKELGIESKHKTLTVLAQVLFNENVLQQVNTRSAMLKKMITSEKHEKALLGGTERLVGLEHSSLIAQVPKILMAFYQEDLVSEAVVSAWGSKASRKYVDLPISKKVRKAAEPFLTWLAEAESDEDSE